LFSNRYLKELKSVTSPCPLILIPFTDLRPEKSMDKIPLEPKSEYGHVIERFSDIDSTLG
jgi:hypothetical protein